MLASVATDAGRLSELVAAFVEQGVAVVHRLGGWDAAVAIARRTYDAQARQHADAARPPQPQATA
jgi:hypothetical protein